MIIPNAEQMATFESYRYKDGELTLGEYEGCWPYFDENGEPCCFSVRYAPLNSDSSKEFRPFYYYGKRLISKYPSETRPIYNLPELIKNKEKLVLLVEGEKTADRAQIIFPEYCVITWMGGSPGAKSVDLTHLKDRKVCLWPDNDIAGYKAMNTIKSDLQWIASKIGVANPKNVNYIGKGWDLGDITDADLNSGIYDIEYIKNIIEDSFIEIKELSIESYPHFSNSKKPYPLDTSVNVSHLLNHFKIINRWNMMKRVREITVPGVNFYNEESENASLNYITDLAILNGLKTKRIDKHLDAIAWENIYHPVREWIQSTSLKEPLLDSFLTNIKTTNDHLSHILIKRWMISAIAALYNEGGFCAQGVLVIQGEQGTHKTSFITSLVPQHLDAVKSGLSVDPSKKDDIFTAAEYWIAELGELDATFRKADIARLKAHINSDEDTVRRPHAIRNSKMIRRTVFAATVNESKYLVDTTGNRRWWTISIIDKINTRHGLDMQQVWREIYELWKNGESPTLTEHELSLLHVNNENYEFIEPFEEKLDVFFDWDITERTWMNSTQVLMNIGYDKPSKSDCTRMGMILVKRNVPKGTGRERRSFYMPRSNFDRQKQIL